MPRTICQQAYKFDELEEEAKEKAREWYRNGAFDYEWHECVVEDAKTVAKFLGWTVERVYFSGFWSQGDGACFEGEWDAKNVDLRGLKKYAPVDKELHTYCRALRDIAKRNREGYASVEQRGHYPHSGCTAFNGDVGKTEENWMDFKDNSRWFMNWIYQQLEKEFDYLNSDEQVDESIRANEYEFDETGKRV